MDRPSWGKAAIGILFLMLAMAWLTGCASKQAGLMASKAQTELAVYVGNANAKVHQAEDARLELELRLLQEDVKNIIAMQLANPERAAKEIIGKVKLHIDARDTRLQVWDSSNLSAANVNRLLQAIGEYNSIGVTTQDIINTLSIIPIPTPKAVTPSVE